MVRCQSVWDLSLLRLGKPLKGYEVKRLVGLRLFVRMSACLAHPDVDSEIGSDHFGASH